MLNSAWQIVDAQDFPDGSLVKNNTSQCRRHEFDPLSRKIPRDMEQLSLCTTSTGAALQRPGEARRPKSSCSAQRDAATGEAPQPERLLLTSLERAHPATRPTSASISKHKKKEKTEN